MIICDIALYKVLLVNSENHDLKEALELSNLKNELGLEYYNKMKVSIAELHISCETMIISNCHILDE